MKQILENLYSHKTLDREEAKVILMEIASGKFNSSQIASFMTAFIMRNITLDELMGFRDALLALCIKVDLSEFNPMDVCGTGGDGKNTFNISTLTSFVAAGAGIPIAKHGNYGVSSVSGSSNVMEYLGISFETNTEKLKSQLEAANICYLHAPLFHPALKNVGPVRKEMGVRTFFNMLGPLVNPAQPKIQMTGVFSAELARMYQYLLQQEHGQYSIVYALDGYDEITLTDNTKVVSNLGERIFTPQQFGLSTIAATDLYGGDTVEQAAKIFMDVLQAKGTTAQQNAVLANASLAIKTYHPEKSFEETLAMAKESLFNHHALASFSTLKQLQ
jgi:anthranilate phosphoribosyltransferase